MTPVAFFAFLWVLALAAYSNSEMRSLVESLGKGYIRLTEANYKKHLYGHRDYDVILFMTSQAPQLNCALCREYTPTFEAAAHLYVQTYPNGVESGKDVYFLYADFLDGKKLFEEMGLDTIPKLFHLASTPESTKDSVFQKETNQFPFYQGNFMELTLQWILQVTGHHVDVHTPPDYGKMVFNAIATFATVLLFKRYRAQVFAIFLSSFLWGAATILLVLLFISGQMFTQIRSVPFMNEKPSGAEIISPNAQMQYGVETQIVSSLYGLLGITFIFLANRASTIKNAKVQFLAVTLLTVLVYFLYSVFMSIFNIKYRGYPFMLFGIPGI